MEGLLKASSKFDIQIKSNKRYNYVIKYTIQLKDESQNGRKLCSMHKVDRELISRLYKEFP